MTEQMLRESVHRVIRFTGMVPAKCDIFLAHEPLSVTVEFARVPEQKRLLVAAAAEGLDVTLIMDTGWVTDTVHRFTPATTANPLLDLMNDYQVWRRNQPKA